MTFRGNGICYDDPTTSQVEESSLEGVGDDQMIFQLPDNSLLEISLYNRNLQFPNPGVIENQGIFTARSWVRGYAWQPSTIFGIENFQPPIHYKPPVVSSVVVDPENSQIFYMGAFGYPINPPWNADPVVFKSVDSGTSWNFQSPKVLFSSMRNEGLTLFIYGQRIFGIIEASNSVDNVTTLTLVNKSAVGDSWSKIADVVVDVPNCGDKGPGDPVSCGGLAPVPIVFSDGSVKLFYTLWRSDGSFRETSLDISSYLPQTCAQLGGYICVSGEVCPKTSLPTSDTNQCCSVACVQPSWTLCSQCGQGLFNFCDQNECHTIVESCYFEGGFGNLCVACSALACGDYNNQADCQANRCSLSDCVWQNNQCVTLPPPSFCVDADSDSYNITGGSCGAVDCNDNNAAVKPGVTEICNNIDDDCDGQVDGGGVCTQCQTNADCSDGLFCNGNEQCVGGQCVTGTPPSVNDNVACTVDSCNEATDSIVHTLNNALCNNGLYCDGTETCTLTGCQAGTAVSCNDGISCTVDSCNEQTDSCQFNTNACQCTTNAQCDDSNSCTDDVCSSGTCQHTNDNTNTCNDNLFCTVNDRCSAGACVSDPRNVDDSVSCTQDSCSEATDTIVHTPNNAICQNGLYCDGTETCTLTGCQAGTPPSVNDNVACTIDSCSENTDSIVHTLNNALCNNGLYCDGTETCTLTGCQAGTAVSCNDGISCTVDSCNEQTDSCQFNTNACQCTTNAQCDDSNSCTDDVCSSGTCQHTNDNTNTCNDNLFCTVNDRCSAGSCISDSRNANDNILCTIDSCDEMNDRVNHIANNTVCDDGLYCTGVEICNVNSGCQAGTAVVCSDGISCTVDSCNEASDSCTYAVIDNDRDTFSICAGVNFDCNDNNANVNTGNAEICNSIDDNCNAVVDEGCQCALGQNRSCGNDVGICQQGLQTCLSNGLWSSACAGEILPSLEICNTLDDNCDSQIDEGGVCDLCRTVNCGINSACNNQTRSCVCLSDYIDCDGDISNGCEVRSADECSVCAVSAVNQTRSCEFSDKCSGMQTCLSNQTWGTCERAGDACTPGVNISCSIYFNGQICTALNGTKTCDNCGGYGRCDSGGAVCCPGEQQSCIDANGCAGTNVCSSEGQWGGCQKTDAQCGEEQPEPECNNNDNCKEDEYCEDNECFTLHCEANQTIEDHTCILLREEQQNIIIRTIRDAISNLAEQPTGRKVFYVILALNIIILLVLGIIAFIMLRRHKIREEETQQEYSRAESRFNR